MLVPSQFFRPRIYSGVLAVVLVAAFPVGGQEPPRDSVPGVPVEVFVFKAKPSPRHSRLMNRQVFHEEFLGQLIGEFENGEAEMQKLVGTLNSDVPLTLRAGEERTMPNQEALLGRFDLPRPPEEMTEEVFIGTEVTLEMELNSTISVKVTRDVAPPQMVDRRAGLADRDHKRPYKFVTLKEPRYHRLNARSLIPLTPAEVVYLLAAARDSPAMQPDDGDARDHYVFVRINGELAALTTMRSPLYEVSAALFRLPGDLIARELLRGIRDPDAEQELFQSLRKFVSDGKATLEAQSAITGANRREGSASSELARTLYDPGPFTDAGPEPGGEDIVVPWSTDARPIGTRLSARVMPPRKSSPAPSANLSFRHHLRAPEKVWLKSNLSRPAEEADPESWTLQEQVFEFSGQITGPAGQPLLTAVQKVPEVLAGQDGKSELLVLFARIDSLEPAREVDAIAASADVATYAEYVKARDQYWEELAAARGKAGVKHAAPDDPFADDPFSENFATPRDLKEDLEKELEAQPSFFTEISVFEIPERMMAARLMAGAPSNELFAEAQRLLEAGDARLRGYALRKDTSGVRSKLRISDAFPASVLPVYYFSSFKHAPEQLEDMAVGMSVESDSIVSHDRSLVDLNISVDLAPMRPHPRSFKVHGRELGEHGPTHGRGVVEYAEPSHFRCGANVAILPGEVCLLGAGRAHVVPESEKPVVQLCFARCLLDNKRAGNGAPPHKQPVTRAIVLAAPAGIGLPLLENFEPGVNDEDLLHALLKLVGEGGVESLTNGAVVSRSGLRARLASGMANVLPTHFGASRVAAGTGWESWDTGITLEVDPVVGADGSSIHSNIAVSFIERRPLREWGFHSRHPERTVELADFRVTRFSGATALRSGKTKLVGVVKGGHLADDAPDSRFRFLFVRQFLSGMSRRAAPQPADNNAPDLINLEVALLRGDDAPNLANGIPDTHTVAAYAQVTARGGRAAQIELIDHTSFLAARRAAASGELSFDVDQLRHGLALKIEGVLRPDGAIEVGIESLESHTAAPIFPTAAETFAHIAREKDAGRKVITPLPPRVSAHVVKDATVTLRDGAFHLLWSSPAPEADGMSDHIVIRARRHK